MRFGVVGTGGMARTMMKAFGAVPDARVVAVASRSEDRAAQFAQRHGIDRHFGSIRSLADHPDVDVVYVASQPRDHVEDCRIALEAGKAVLCEKPLATSVREAEELADVASRKGVFLMEGMWLRFLPAVRRAEQLTRERAVGAPRLLQADFGYPVAPGSSTQGTDVGVLLDRAVYPISLAILLLGVPKESASFVVRDDRGVACDASFLLRHEGGALSQLAVSSQAYLGNRAIISCENGRIELGEPLLGTERIEVRHHAPLVAEAHPDDSHSMKQRVVETLKSSSLLRRLRAYHSRRGSADFESYGVDPYAPQLEEVVKCVGQGELQSPLMPITHTIEALRIIEGCPTDSSSA